MRTLSTTLSLCASLVLASLLLAGCGGDGRSASDPEPQLSKRQYIARFNDLQEDAATVFARFDEAIADPKLAKQQEAAFTELITGARELRPPTIWRDEHRRMVAALEQMREAMGVIVRAPAAKPAVVETQVERFSDATRDFQAAVADVNATR